MSAAVLVCCVFAFWGGAAEIDFDSTERLVWTDPQGREPMTYADWSVGREAELDRCRIGLAVQTDPDPLAGFTGVVDVVVNAELYPDVATEVVRYMSDLSATGYNVRLDTMRGLSHQGLRDHLANVAGIVGAVLVGELPVAWYEDGWGGSPTGEEFPIELYFMDLDGNWVDADADGLYDQHTGDVAPEIWVGRLYARPLTWDDEARLIRRYFDKNHAYRTGNLSLPDRALAYVDDDWYYYRECNMDLAYSSVDAINDRSTTRASDYRDRLDDGYEFIHICAHSSPWGHTFSDYSNHAGTVFNTEVYAIRPHAHFYNLFACSGTRFVEENCSAGWDIFQDDYGLVAVGSGKTGSMLYFADFYRPLGNDSCIGEAFKKWFIVRGESSRDWFYAMNVLGDPTLTLHGNSVGEYAGAEPEPLPPTAAEVVGTDPETDDSPQLLAMPEGDVWAIWKSGRSVRNGRFDIFASVRDDTGWSSPYNIGAHEYWDTDPAMGLDSFGRPVAVWANFTPDYHYNLYYSVWNGTGWSARRELSEDCASDLAPSLATDSAGTLWCLWTSRRELFADVWASSYNGYSWTTPVNVTADSLDELHPKAAVMSDRTVWVVYTKYRNEGSEIWARYRDGSSWVETGPVSGSQTRAFRPSITVGVSGSPVVCWQGFDTGNGEIWFSEYEGTWSEPAVVDADSGLDVHPAMATDRSGLPWVVWMSDRDGDWNVYYSFKASVDWIPGTPVEQGTGLDLNPAIAAGDDEMWVVWQNLSSGNWDINARAIPMMGIRSQPEPRGVRLVLAPNPFTTRLNITLPQDAKRVEIVDAAGRVVAEPGPEAGRALWDGRSRSGSRLGRGAYFVRVSSGQGVLTARAVYLRD
ncbi:MAG: T9SS type A sorting domain-containing protein [candidate division WOR-3 bacterium]|nr:MAG: T9SS type A sorting domain-containing protein [candidate division WOR-3 bacterium]